MTELEQRWTRKAQELLVGRRIVAVGYTNDAELDAWGWGARGLVLDLDDGAKVFVMQDDEGNGPGALQVLGGAVGAPTAFGHTLPVLSE